MDALMIATGGVPPPGTAGTPAAGDPAIAGGLRGTEQPAPFAMLMAALAMPAGQSTTAPASGDPSTVPGLAEDGPGVMLSPHLAGAVWDSATGEPEFGSTEPLMLRPDRAAEAGASGLESILAALLLTAPVASPSTVAAGIPAAPLAGLVAHNGETIPALFTGGDSAPGSAPSPEDGRHGVEVRSLDVAMRGPTTREGSVAPGRPVPFATVEGPVGGLPVGALAVGTVPVGAGPASTRPAGTGRIGDLAGGGVPGLAATTAADGPAVPPVDRVPSGSPTSLAPVAGAEVNAASEALASRQAPAIEAGVVEPAADRLDGTGTPIAASVPAAAGFTSTGGLGDASAGVAGERGVVDSTSGAALADGLAESVQGALRRGDREMRLVLNPPELGEVHVRVQESAAGVRVALEAATREAHDLIQRHLPALREGLASRDLPIDRLDVHRLERGVDGQALDGGAGRGASGDGQAGNRWAGAPGEGFGSPAEPGWSPVTRLGLGGRAIDERSSTGAGRAASPDAAAGRIDVRA